MEQTDRRRIERGIGQCGTAVLAEMTQSYPHQALSEFATYPCSQAGRIADYAALRAAGQTIGCGVGEKSVDIVVNRRLKGRRGMCWMRARTDAGVALRFALLNDEWDDCVAIAQAA